MRAVPKMNWGEHVRNTAIAIGMTFVAAAGNLFGDKVFLLIDL
jgi:hypothetical protein